MAQFFFVGGNGTNINATAPTNWAATSGGANNAGTPGAGDEAILDANSGPTVTLNVNTTYQKFKAGAFTGNIVHSASVIISLNTAAADTLILPSAGTYSPANNVSGFTMIHTSGNADITSNGKRFGQLLINGAGGTTRLLDAFRCDLFSSSAIGITTGGFNGNGQTVTINAINSSNSNTRSLDLGGGLWSLGGGAVATQTIWNMATVTNLTFTKNTSNIQIPSNNVGGYRLFAGGGLTFNGLTIDQNSARGMIFFSGANTFSALSVGGGNTLALPTGVTTIQSAPMLVGTPSLPILILGNTPGNASTISCPSGTFSLSWGSVRDITASGGASFVADNSFDHGNNSGWAISAPSIAPSVSDIVNGLLDTADTIEAGLTVRQALRLQSAILGGKVSGAGTGTETFRNAVADTKNRAIVIDDASGNRSAITYDFT